VAEIHIKRLSRNHPVAVQDTPVTVGRSSRNTLVLASHSVSRRHCVIERIDGTPHVRDLGSRHGTRVNGRRVDGTEPLAHGDTIRLGQYELTFVDPEHAAPAAGLVELEAERDGLEAERAKLDTALAEAHEQIETARVEVAAGAEALEQERRERAEAAAARDGAQRELEALRERYDGAEASAGERQAEAERAREELADVTERLAAAEADATAERAEVAALRTEAHAARQRADAAEHDVARLEAIARPLREGSERVAAIQQNLAELEELWLELDDMARDQRAAESGALDEILAQREALAGRLELAHAARDDALADLYARLEGFRASGLPPLRGPDRPRSTVRRDRLRGARSARSVAVLGSAIIFVGALLWWLVF
jgi:hypothetical protein